MFANRNTSSVYHEQTVWYGGTCFRPLCVRGPCRSKVLPYTNDTPATCAHRRRPPVEHVAALPRALSPGNGRRIVAVASDNTQLYSYGITDRRHSPVVWGECVRRRGNPQSCAPQACEPGATGSGHRLRHTASRRRAPAGARSQFPSGATRGKLRARAWCGRGKGSVAPASAVSPPSGRGPGELASGPGRIAHYACAQRVARLAGCRLGGPPGWALEVAGAAGRWPGRDGRAATSWGGGIAYAACAERVVLAVGCRLGGPPGWALEVTGAAARRPGGRRPGEEWIA